MLTAAAACSRCDDALDAALRSAESCMDTAPDSAHAILSKLPPVDAVEAPGQRARLALLRARVSDKCAIDITSDSLTAIAIDYYTSTDDRFHRMLANYCHARVLYHTGDYAHALVSLLEAETDALALDNKYYLGLIYQNMAFIYTDTYNLTAELQYAWKSHDALKQTDHKTNYHWSILFLATSYHNSDDYRKALELCDTVIAIATDTNNIGLLKEALQQSAYSSYGIKDYDTAIASFQRLISIDPQYMEDKDYAILARSYIRTDRPDSGQIYLDMVKTNQPFVFWCDHDMARNAGDYKAALKAALLEYNYLDSICNTYLKDNLILTVNEYQNGKKNMLEIQSQRRITNIVTGASIAALLLIIIIFILIYELINYGIPAYSNNYTSKTLITI